MIAARLRVVVLLALLLAAMAASSSAQAKLGRRRPLNDRLRAAGFVGLVRVDSVSWQDRAGELVRVPTGTHPVVESAHGRHALVELRTDACGDLGPVWFDGAYALVIDEGDPDGRLQLSASDLRFPVGLNAARTAWRVIEQGLVLAGSPEAPPAEVWTEWIIELLKRPSLRDDGLFELRAALERRPGGLPLARTDLLVVRPALQAMLQADDVSPGHAQRAAELAHLLGHDVSDWVLDELGAWADAADTSAPDAVLLDWLDARRLGRGPRQLVVRLRAALARGDHDAARVDAADLLHELGWLPPGLSPVEAARAAVADVPAHEWLLRLDDERVTRADLESERPDGSGQSLAEVASALALRHFALDEFERHADRDPEAAWLLEVTRDPEAAVENEAVAAVAWGGVLSRLIWPRYGGRTAYYSFGGSIALDAYTDLLREQVDRGRLAVRDELAPLFWAELADDEGGHLAEPQPDDDVESLFPPFWRRLSGGGPLAEDAAGR